MIGSDIEVRGPFSDLPPLARVGNYVAFAAFVIFGEFVPIGAAVAVLAGVGTAASNWQGEAGALGFVAAMAAIGAWTNGRYLRWLRGDRLGAAGWCCFNAACILCSAALAWGAVALHCLPIVLAIALAVVVLGLILSSILANVGHVLTRTK